MLFASRDVSKCDRFCNMSSGKKSQERVSNEAQVKISTLIKKVEINEETENFVSWTNVDLVTTTMQQCW